jgi:hypothetical protein
MGTAERLVTMVLNTFDRGHVAWFIGAWVALKFALNYKRREMKKTLITNKRARISRQRAFIFVRSIRGLAVWSDHPHLKGTA